MRYEEVREIHYSHRLQRRVYFVLIYQVSAGPRPGIEKWFLVHRKEEEDVHIRPANLPSVVKLRCSARVTQ